MAPQVGSIPSPGQEKYYPYPESTFKLNNDLHIGMFPLGLLGAASVLATLVVIGTLTWQMVRTRNRKEFRLYQRQLLILYYNLLIADFLQALSFLFSFHWEAIDAILAPTGACWAQGWLLHIGDVASGCFVFAIALHTWFSVVRWKREASYRTFVIYVLAMWGFCVAMATLPPAIRGKNIYVKAAAWCWINVKYEADRLWSHYIWIFIFEFGTVLLYLSIGLKLRKHLRFFKSVSGQSSTLERQQKYMMIYPTIYVVLTLPLAASRMWSMANSGRQASDPVMITAGCLITSCGWMDALMYSLTRNVLASRQTPRSGSIPYHSREARGPGPGAATRPVGGTYAFDDLTQLRTETEWEGDGDITPPGTTTTIIGGKNVETRIHGLPVQNGARESGAGKPIFSRKGSNKSANSRYNYKDNNKLEDLSEGDEKELINMRPELPRIVTRPGRATVPSSGRTTPGSRRLSPNPAESPYNMTRGQSPASSETIIPSYPDQFPRPNSPPFGQVKVERTTTVTRTDSL